MPPSHFLLPGAADAVPGVLEAALSEGFTRFKLKVGGEREAEERLLRFLARRLAEADGQPRLRLDYNETLTASEFAARFARLPDLLPVLDFVEDPCPFDADTWAELSRATGSELALDRAADTEQFVGTLIHKPARFGPEPPATAARRVVVTTYLDHPLGQLCAAWVAARLGTAETHGLVSHRAYARNDFSEQLSWRGPDLMLPGGTGFGFDDELARLDWKQL